MILSLIPATYRWAAWLGVAFIIAAIGAWASHAVTAAHYRPKLEKAQARAEELEAAYLHLAQASQHQNEAIDQLQRDAKVREARAVQAVAQARQAASATRDQATAIMGLKLPAGADECSAARDAFDDELQSERGKR